MQSALVFILLVGVASAQFNPQFNALGGGGSQGGAMAAGGATAPAGLAAGPAFGNIGNPWGARAYGMGLNNRWAVPVNPFLMRRALALVNNVPGALVRVDVDGDLSITNQFGQEIDIHDGFGNDLTDLF